LTYKPLPYPWPRLQQWAPAWFYSALHWLGKSYYDASNVQQTFNQYVAGSDVDPYARLGSTRLFVIYRTDDVFSLTLAADAQSDAPATGGTQYPNTDEGIGQMYLALSASAIFDSIKYCYIPGRIGSDLDPTPATFAAASSLDGLAVGYDPATGLRAVVLGSAVAQVVPLDDFLTTHNEQIYNDSPAIVPVVDALVYDVTQYNQPGATTFLLPVFYTRDQVSPQNYYVSRFQSATQVAGVSAECGQTVLFPGGPGYNDAAATPLKLDGTAQIVTSGLTFTTYTFDTATVVSTIPKLGSKIQPGAISFTYSSSSPSLVFAEQRIIGFYRDNKWKTCLGVPIYDRHLPLRLTTTQMSPTGQASPSRSPSCCPQPPPTPSRTQAHFSPTMNCRTSEHAGARSRRHSSMSRVRRSNRLTAWSPTSSNASPSSSPPSVPSWKISGARATTSPPRIFANRSNATDPSLIGSSRSRSECGS
jgi:hypothetical protein